MQDHQKQREQRPETASRSPLQRQAGAGRLGEWWVPLPGVKGVGNAGSSSLDKQTWKCFERQLLPKCPGLTLLRVLPKWHELS